MCYYSNFLSYNGLEKDIVPVFINLTKVIPVLHPLQILDAHCNGGILFFSTEEYYDPENIKTLSKQKPDVKIKFSCVNEDLDEFFAFTFENGVLIDEHYFDAHDGEDPNFLDMCDEDDDFDDDEYWRKIKSSVEAEIDRWHSSK